jgi:S-disulfanyl-L-cysteine oxidoreductase SoxD
MRRFGAAALVIASGAAIPLFSADLEAQGVASAGVYTNGQAARGRALYQARCASCHGGALAGEDTNPPLAGGRFLANWSGQSIGALARRIRSTMPLEDPGSLTLRQTTDVVAYMFQANAFRGGKVELPPDAEQLNRLRIDTPRRGR